MSRGFLLFAMVIGVAVSAEDSLRDPTQPLGYRSSARAVDAVVLQAIFSGDGRRTAIINGQSVQTGDTVAGRKIIQIREHEVLIADGGVQRVLKLRTSIFDK